MVKALMVLLVLITAEAVKVDLVVKMAPEVAVAVVFTAQLLLVLVKTMTLTLGHQTVNQVQ